MTCKTMVVVTSGEEEDARVLSVAAKLATRFSARVLVVPAYPDAAADYVGYGTALASAKTREAALVRIREGEREAQRPAKLRAVARDICPNDQPAAFAHCRARPRRPARRPWTAHVADRFLQERRRRFGQREYSDTKIGRAHACSPSAWPGPLTRDCETVAAAEARAILHNDERDLA